jgi:RCC1 and BTB domain-containing protein
VYCRPRPLTPVLDCQGFHSACVTEDEDVYTWWAPVSDWPFAHSHRRSCSVPDGRGGGEHGQLGHGDKVNRTSPCLVEAMKEKGIIQVRSCLFGRTVPLGGKQAACSPHVCLRRR